MAKSLQEQLMGAGLVDKTKAKAIQKAKRVKRKQGPKGQSDNSDETIQLDKLRQEKIEKDKALNSLRMQELERKAIQAQIKQLFLSNQVKREHGDQAFQFTHDKKIKKIYLSQTQFEHLTRGLLAIGSVNGEYVLVPVAVAQKIRERDEQAVHYFYEQVTKDKLIDQDDPYKGFEIPDDLMW